MGGEDEKRKDFPPVSNNEFKWKGVGRLTMLPPRSLDYPFLVSFNNNQPIYTLCRSCSEEKENVKSCTHTDTERAITNNWCHQEILKSISLGYSIMAYHTIWYWQDFRTDLYYAYAKIHLQIKKSIEGWSPESIEPLLAKYNRLMTCNFSIKNTQLSKAAFALVNINNHSHDHDHIPRKIVFTSGEGIIHYIHNHILQVRDYFKLCPDLYLISIKLPKSLDSDSGKGLYDCMLLGQARTHLYDTSDMAAFYDIK